MIPDSAQQEERSTYEIWAPPENNTRMKQWSGAAEWQERKRRIKKTRHVIKTVNLVSDLEYSHLSVVKS